MRHGPDLEEMGGTKIDSELNANISATQVINAFAEPNKNFLEHYIEEIKEQLRGGPPQKK